GQPQMELWVSADTPDADWVVKLIDVHPDGYCHALATGVRRGSARDSELDRSPLGAGKKYLLKVDLGPAGARAANRPRRVVRVHAGLLACGQVVGVHHAPTYGRTSGGLSGPGILLAGTSVGAGEWLFGPAVTAQFGGTFLWLATLSIVGQVFYNLEVMRYALY